jgi:hypothetical protein
MHSITQFSTSLKHQFHTSCVTNGAHRFVPPTLFAYQWVITLLMDPEKPPKPSMTEKPHAMQHSHILPSRN